MKYTSVLFVAMLFLTVNISAQNWSLFPTNQKSYFEFSSEEKYAISIYSPDSVNVQVDETQYFYLLKEINDQLQAAEWSCLDVAFGLETYREQFDNLAGDIVSLVNPVIEKNDQYFFDDKLVYDKNVAVGEYFSLPMPDSLGFDEIRFECISNELETIVSVQDKVKTFDINAYSGGSQVSSDFTKFEFKVSESYGIISTIPFPELVKGAPKTQLSMVGFTDAGNNLIGRAEWSILDFVPYKAGDLVSNLRVREFADYLSYDFPIGEERTHSTDSIISVNETTDKIEVTFNRKEIIEYYNYLSGEFTISENSSEETKIYSITDDRLLFSRVPYGFFLESNHTDIYEYDGPRFFINKIEKNNTQLKNENAWNLSAFWSGGFDLSGIGFQGPCELVFAILGPSPSKPTYNTQLGLIGYNEDFYQSGFQRTYLTAYESGDDFWNSYGFADLASQFCSTDGEINLEETALYDADSISFSGPGVVGNKFYPNQVSSDLLSKEIEIVCEIFYFKNDENRHVFTSKQEVTVNDCDGACAIQISQFDFDCTSVDNINATIDLTYSNVSSPTFDLFLDFELFGTFNYTDLPIEVALPQGFENVTIGNNFEACLDEITFENAPCTSIEELTNADISIIQISGVLNIYSQTQFTEVVLYDLTGKLINQNINTNQNRSVNIDISGIASGIYLLYLSDNDKYYTRKILVK